MYADETIRRYLDDASAGTPTPGGGSIAALAGAAGLSMACMAANFTVGKKKFAAVQEETKDCLARCVRARDELLSLVDQDVAAYAGVSAAYALPKESPEQKDKRTQEIQSALTQAMAPPLGTVRVCVEALRVIGRLADIANPNLISDVGVAAILSEAALRAGKLNVEINLREMRDQAAVATTRSEIESASVEAAGILQTVQRKVADALGAKP